MRYLLEFTYGLSIRFYSKCIFIVKNKQTSYQPVHTENIVSDVSTDRFIQIIDIGRINVKENPAKMSEASQGNKRRHSKAALAVSKKTLQFRVNERIKTWSSFRIDTQNAVYIYCMTVELI